MKSPSSAVNWHASLSTPTRVTVRNTFLEFEEFDLDVAGVHVQAHGHVANRIGIPLLVLGMCEIHVQQVCVCNSSPASDIQASQHRWTVRSKHRENNVNKF